MEERIIDDEYGRGVRLRKTKDGYVDVTDELADGQETEDGEESVAAEEIAIEFPEFEEYEDEDLIGLDPAEVERRRQEKAAEAARIRAEYEQYCKEGDEFLAAESFKAAALKYEKAYKLDENPKEAALGLWRAKTENFTQPDVLMEEYAEIGVETMEYDLGWETLEVLKQEYGDIFRRRLAELTEEERLEQSKPNDSTVEDSTTNNQNSATNDTDEEGCNSSMNGFGIIFGMAVVAMLTVINKNRKEKKNEN